MKLPVFLVLLMGLIIGILPCGAGEKGIELGNARFVQKVRSMEAVFVHGMDLKKGEIKKPVHYAFYVGVEEPVTLKDGDLERFAKPTLKATQLSEEEIGKMPMMEAQAYLVLLDEERKPVALLSNHGGGVTSFSEVVNVGKDLFQNDPNSISDSYHRIAFPNVKPMD